MKGRLSVLRIAAALMSLGLVGIAALPVSGVPREPGKYSGSGITGSGSATMQPVNTGLRIALVASVPGSGSRQAWGVGTSIAKVPGWAGESGGGQTIFARYTPSTGWQVMGPPLSPSGQIINPKLTSLSIAPNGEGWAVGDKGAMLRLEGDRWTAIESKTTKVLTAVSVGSDSGSTYGFAVSGGSLADPPLALRLQGGNWTSEELPVSDEEIHLASVAASSSSEAWAAGSSSGALAVLRRTSDGWRRVNTGRELFDGKSARNIEGSVIAATRAAASAVTGGGAWVGGTIVPVDLTGSLTDPAGDASRPFAVFFDRSGNVTTYCPDQYSVSGNNEGFANAMCDEPFPLSGFGISSMHAFSSPGKGEVFAGGPGVFHFKGGQWFREPNPVSSVSSVSFTNPSEGWVAGTGNTVGAGGSVSSIGTLGHWTRSTSDARVARWPQPVTDPASGTTFPLEQVAVAPDRSGRALAVGQQGAMYAYSPDAGWDALPPVNQLPLHGLAWPSAGRAWAVGSRGSILSYDGARWSPASDSERLTKASLLSVAFASPNLGYAVGAGGVVLRFNGTRWVKDARATSLASSDDLFSVTAAGGEFVAAGANGRVLETRDGRWVDASVESLIGRGTGQNRFFPALYAASGLADGTVFVGGESSTLIRRDGRNGSWRIDSEGKRLPPEGTVLALAARRAGGGTQLFASVSYEQVKFTGESLAAISGFLLLGTSDGWKDLDHKTKLTAYQQFDASAPRDPVYGIAIDGSKAWAVGGIGVGADDGQGHGQAYPTSSIYRVDPSGDPRAVSNAVVPPLDSDPNVISFAFFGESSCGRGLCSLGMGSGTKADVVAAQIREEVNRMSKLKGGPKFAMFGGNMRRTGIPEELGEFKNYVGGFDVPFYAALGGQDLFSNLSSALSDQPIGGLQTGGSNSHNFYLSTFADRPQPWGTSAPPRGFLPVYLSATGQRLSQNPCGGAACTHYAFDYAPSGKRLLRVVVLDASAPGRISQGSTQNPPEDQTTWLTQVLNQARDHEEGSIPSIIIMNRPSADPLNPLQERFLEAQGIEGTAQVSASAVLTSYFRENAVFFVEVSGVPGTTPIYVLGGGGAPLEGGASDPPRPSLGYYHAWQLVSVDLGRRTGVNDAKAQVSVRSFPLIDTVAMQAVDGTRVAGGNVLRFVGSGRAPEGGFPHDPVQAFASVVPMEYYKRGICPPDIRYRNNPVCQGTGGVGPTYQFISDDPSIGTFVVPDPLNERAPLLDEQGRVFADPSSGLFCSFKAGTTNVSLVSGFHIARKKVTVTGGSGPCIKGLVPEIEVLRRSLSPEASFIPLARAPSQPFLFHPTIADTAQLALVPPPAVPILAPAPPVAGGYARKEEEEAQTETQSQEGDAEARAVQHPGRYDPMEDPLILLTFAALVSVLAAGVAGSVANARRKPQSLNVNIWDAKGRRR